MLPASSPRTSTLAPTPNPTTTGYALLGLLKLRPWTTYELTKQVRRSLRWFWPRAERRLYDEPKRLVAAGLAEATSERTGKRPRTVYDITDAGRVALRDWLDRPPAPRSTEFEGLLKVFFADAGSLAQLQVTLDRIAVEAEERLTEVVGLAEAWLRDPTFPERAHLGAVGLALQREQEEAVLRWAQWALAATERWESTQDPGAWSADEVFRRMTAD